MLELVGTNGADRTFCALSFATGTGLPGPFQEDDGLATMPVKRTVPVVRSRSA